MDRPTLRTLEALTAVDDPGVDLLRDWAARPDANPCLLLPPDESLRGETLVRLQVTTRSLLGAIAYETGGVVAADGVIRLLGSGSLRSLLALNDAVGGMQPGGDAFVLVADDCLGGLFALNGGRFGPDGLGEIFHLAADDTLWTPLKIGYSDFVSWCVTGDLGRLYAPFAERDAFRRRPRPPIDRTISFYPFLWSAEARERAPSEKLVDADEAARFRIETLGFAVG